MRLKFYIKTYGCQMNERDSESLAAALIDGGFDMTDTESDADILLFNTCSVREQAERKAVGKIGIMKKLKRKNPDLLIGVFGCMAQSRKDELLVELPHLDFVVGTDNLHRIVGIINDEIADRQKIVVADIDTSGESLEAMGGHLLKSGGAEKREGFSAYISLMRGCNRFCTYCIVPYVRGREKSRSVESIIEESERLAASGIKEIMLLGQNVAAYGLDGRLKAEPGESPFADLLAELNKVEGIERIRFTSPHPACFNGKLIGAVSELSKVCDNIHLPLQSGSDKILKAMHRGYTSGEYLSIVKRLKSLSPGVTFSTDVIVGFPGETESDFNMTRDIFNNVGFDNAFIFKYSPRRGTNAAEMDDDVPISEKERRNHILLDDLKKITSEHNRSIIGKKVQVLVEGVSKRNSDRWFGRTTSNKTVVFTPTPDILIGELVDLVIEETTSATLFGALLN
jgi:tRNA-2-methylthio-N6-dimethylallyladenosine synthase